MKGILTADVTPEKLLKVLAIKIEENHVNSKRYYSLDELTAKDLSAAEQWGVKPTIENSSFPVRLNRLSYIFRELLSGLSNLPVISPYMDPRSYEEGFGIIRKSEGWMVYETTDISEFVKGDMNWSMTAVRLKDNKPQEAYGYFPRKKYMMIARLNQGVQGIQYSEDEEGNESQSVEVLHTSNSIPAKNMVIPRYPIDASDHLLAAPFRIAFYQTEQDIDIHMINSVLARARLIASGEVEFGYDVEYIHKNKVYRIPRALLAASELFVTEAGGYCCNLDGKPIDYSRERPDGTGYLMCNNAENAAHILARINETLDRKTLLAPETGPLPADLSALLAPRRGHRHK